MGHPPRNPLPEILVIVCMLAAAGIAELHRRWRLWVSQSWPSAEGTIDTGNVGQDGGKQQRWAVRVTYTFRTAGGERYGGTAAHYVAGPEEGRGYLSRVQGTKVPVRYRPGNPHDSIAELPE